MSKIFVFGIGGTGSRVLKALTMLLAAGVKTKASEIVPIIIDPDSACGDKTDTVAIMNQYSTLFDSLSHQEGENLLDSFSTKLSKLDFTSEYVMPMGDNTNTQFQSYMHFASLSQENQALVNMLFSKDNQNADMSIGFTGNPNIGSVVLNQFSKSTDFLTFASNFAPGDKIFIISSIFGGTGASGFPLLLKNLRFIDPTLNIPNAAAIAASEIGAITILPYFNVKSEDNAKIDSDSFVSKTKSALSYYERNLNGLNVLYYIGDSQRGVQEYGDGGIQQRNEANFVELASALAIVDFANNSYTMPSTVYKEFGINKDVADITFPDLGSTTYNQIAKPLTEFTLFSKYLKERLHSSTSQVWLENYVNSVVGGQFYGILSQFTTAFLNWEQAMESKSHARRFSPFVLEARPKDVFGLVKGIPVTSAFGVSASNWDLYNHYLNKKDCASSANQIGKTEEGKFLSHLLLGTKKVVSKKIKF